MNDAAREQIDSQIAQNDITLFMKGNRSQPQCGFSASVVRMLDSMVPDYQTFDVLSDPELRDNIKDYSSWPTIPQLYVKGEFVGGCDIITKLFENGELATTLGVEATAAVEPSVTITDTAVERLRKAFEESGGPGRDLQISIDARYQANLFIGPAAPGAFAIEADGLKVLIDRVSASRADGITIDVVDTPQGPSLRVDNPNAPQVQLMSVEQLKALIDSGESFELLDVRTVNERETASIPGSTLLTEDEVQRVEGLPKNTKLVFHCHLGGRSQQAAQRFAELGFTDVYNVTGGIEAWSEEIDPSVPRY
jgi:monothiol glutaredoxin